MDPEEQHKLRREFYHPSMLQQKKANQKKKKYVKEAESLCVEWVCQENCVPCIPSICAKFSEIRGKCETCNQKDWVICWFELRKIHPTLLV
ncbi:MAG: hypothetical protein ACE5R6_01145 [Candidatus Heimdallarchaeota archaeon]